MYNVVYTKIGYGRRRECHFVCRCNCYQKKLPFPYSCPCSLCSLCYKDKDGSRTITPIAHIPQISTRVRPYLHVTGRNIYISTQKHKHKHMFKYAKVGWSRMKIEHVRFLLQQSRMVSKGVLGVIQDQTSSDFVVSNMSFATYRTVYHRLYGIHGCRLPVFRRPC